jgi:hypothetical protein
VTNKKAAPPSIESVSPARSRVTVTQHFAGRPASVRATYGAVLKAARRLGTVREDPKKTSIHLARRTAFAGIATRRSSLIFHVQICDQHRESADSQARTRIGQSVVPRGGAGYTAACRSRTMRVAGSVLRARRLTACTSPRRSANLPWAPAASNLRRAVPSHPRWRCSSRFRSRPA